MSDFKEKIKKFRMFLGPEVWNLFILATILGFLWFIVESGFVVVLQTFLMSIGLLDKAKTFLPVWFPTEIWATSLILVGFGMCRGAVLAMRYYFAVSTGQSFICYQKSQILEVGLHNAPNLSTSEVMLSYGEHTNTAAVALSQIALLINNSVSIVLFIITGFYLAPKEFLLSIILLGIVLLPIKLLNRRIGGIEKEINDEKEIANKIIVNGLKNNFFLQIYHLIDSEVGKGKKSLKGFELGYKRYSKVAGIRTALPQTAGAIVIALVTFVSLKYFHTPGSKLLAFFYVFIRMSQCASEFYSVTGDIKIQMIGLKALYTWTEKLQELKNNMKPQDTRALVDEISNIKIEVSNLDFSYKEKTILKDLNFSLETGDILLIKGESGAGKSTLLSLILGLIEPVRGIIKINNLAPHLVRQNLAEKVGYVGPEPYLIEGSIKQNLLYGHSPMEPVSDDLLWWALEKAQLKKEIESLPRQLDENLLDRAQFSTGQKQRLSIARALVRKPLILILDEATANLDAETELKFVDLLSGLTKSMTTIIVSHKDSFNELATKRITLLKRI